MSLISSFCSGLLLGLSIFAFVQRQTALGIALMVSNVLLWQLALREREEENRELLAPVVRELMARQLKMERILEGCQYEKSEGSAAEGK